MMTHEGDYELEWTQKIVHLKPNHKTPQKCKNVSNAIIVSSKRNPQTLKTKAKISCLVTT